MTDYAGYRPDDDSALRWEDCHCTKCGERDRSCTCQKPQPVTDHGAIDRLNAVLDAERLAVVHSLAKPGDWQCKWCGLIWGVETRDCINCNPPPEVHRT